jgi:hypothetical protein
MKNIVESSNLLAVGVVAGSIFVWLPKGLEDLILSPAHTAKQIGDVVDATIAIPSIARSRLKFQADLALFQCENLTAGEKIYWQNLSSLLV